MSASQNRFALWGEGKTLKRVGLMAGAVLTSVALLCATASSASAEQIGVYMAGEASEEATKQPRMEAESYPATLEGSGGGQKFGFQAGTVTCEAVFFGSKLLAPTTAPLLEGGFGWCTSSTGHEITTFRNGCNLVTHINNVGPPYTGELEVQCPSENGYTFIAKSGGSTVCTVVIPSQTGLKGVSFKNTGEGKKRAVEISFNVTGMEYMQKGICNFPKTEPITYNNGTYTGTMFVRAFN